MFHVGLHCCTFVCLVVGPRSRRSGWAHPFNPGGFAGPPSRVGAHVGSAFVSILDSLTQSDFPQPCSAELLGREKKTKQNKKKNKKGLGRFLKKLWNQAHLRSHSGPGGSEALSVCPSKPEFCIEAGSFELWSWRDSNCPCRSQKFFGNAGSSWTDKGDTELRNEGNGTREGVGQGVPREAGATVRCNARLRDMNVVVAAHDDRAIEVLATGLRSLEPNLLHCGARWQQMEHHIQGQPESMALCTRAFRALEGRNM